MEASSSICDELLVAATAPLGWADAGLIAIGIAVSAAFAGLCIGALALYRRSYASGRRALARIYEDFDLVPQSENTVAPGVRIRFHTYCGFLNTLETVEHRVWVRPGRAGALLLRFLVFNLSRGILNAGGAFTPFLSVYYYLREKRRVGKQLKQAAPAGAETHEAPDGWENASPSVTIYIELLDEKIDVWRPVFARKTGPATYEILPNNPKPGDELENWGEFQPGDLVRCRAQVLSRPKLRLSQMGLVAAERVGESASPRAAPSEARAMSTPVQESHPVSEA